jgi:hypothetical protein
MKAPVRELDDNGSLNYAPKKPGRPEQDQNPDRAAPRVDSAPAPNMPESSEPPWKQKKQRGAFAGDIATAELRTRLTLAPDRVPEPKSPDRAVSVFGTMRSLVGVTAIAAAAIVGYRWGSAPQVTPPSQQFAAASDRTDFTPGLAVSTANLKVSNPDSKPTAAPSAASDRANKAGAEAAQAATAGVTSTAAAPPGDAAEIAFLLKNGAALMANGDVAAARLMFQHAAESGSAEAAFALAETYDPLVFKKLGRREAVTLDIALAQSWYEKARNLGSAVARERIVRLTQLPE